MVHTDRAQMAQLSVQRGGHPPYKRDTQPNALQHLGAPRCCGRGDRQSANLDIERGTPNRPQDTRSQLKEQLGSRNKFAHHRGYEGSFVEFSGPEEAPRLMEVCPSQEDSDGEGFLLCGWEYAPNESSKTR